MKTNRILMLITFSLFYFSSFGQDGAEVEATKNRIGIRIGSSAGVGDFGDNNQSNMDAGYAESGVDLQLTYEYKVNQNFAVTAAYGGSALSVDAQTLANQLANQIAQQGLDNEVGVRSENYAIGYLCVGAKGMIGDKVRGYINPQIGFGSIISPRLDIDVTATNGNTTEVYNFEFEETDPGSSLILGIGFGVEFQVSELIDLNLNFNYLSGEAELTQNTTTEIITSSTSVSRQSNDFDQKFSIFNSTIGIAFNF